MNRRRYKVLKVVMIPTIVIVGSVAAAGGGGGDFTVTRSTIDGGGVMRSGGEGFELSGTIGQPDAGFLAGGDFELTGGFWFRIAAGDHDDDGLVDLDDYDAFEGCMTGPDGAAPPTSCEPFDVDHSGAVDLADFATVQTTFTGD
jgi:hypothetical protein